MALQLASSRLDRKRRTRARHLRRSTRAGRFAPVAWLAHIVTPKERT